LVKIRLPSDEIAKEVCKRAVLVNYIIELLSESSDVQGLAKSQANELMAPYAGKRFKIRARRIDKKMKPKEIV